MWLWQLRAVAATLVAGSTSGAGPIEHNADLDGTHGECERGPKRAHSNKRPRQHNAL